MDRRNFLRGSYGCRDFGIKICRRSAQSGALPSSQSWDAGRVRHLLPTVSDTKVLIKASFAKPLTGAPALRIGSSIFRGRMNDTEGPFWQFYATGVQPGRRYSLSLVAADGKSLCQPWDLSTFPGANSRPESCRVLFFTCAGGPDDASGPGSDILTRGNLPTVIRNRMMRRAPLISASGDGRKWRPRLQGLAFTKSSTGAPG